MPFGFNGILLNKTSAALVDVQYPDYVDELLSGLRLGDACRLTTTVKGTVTVYNDAVEQHGTYDIYWDHYNITESSIPSVNLNNDPSVGTLESIKQDFASLDDSWLFVSVYDNMDWGSFPQNATQFSTRRQRCEVTWAVHYNLVEIVDGSCDPEPLLAVNQSLGSDYWYLPSLYRSQWKILLFTKVVLMFLCNR